MTDRTAVPLTGIGTRLRELRKEQGLNQTELATAADVSVVLIQKLEQGARHTASLPSLHKLARALDVDLSRLLDKPSTLQQASENTGVVALRRALTGIDDLLPGDGDTPTRGELRRSATYAWGSYWAGRYDHLGSMLPTALVKIRAANPVGEDADFAAQLYQAAGCTLVHLGQADAAHLAVREAMRMARSGTDPLRPAALRGTLSWLLLTQGRFDEARRLAASTAESIEPGNRSDLPRMTLCGSLLLSAATAAGRAGDRAGAQQLLVEAGRIAGHTGFRNDYEVAFGPDQVTMQTVDVHVVTEAYPEAVTAARRMPRETPLPLAARARHLQDRAFAHTKLGHADKAVGLLETMRHMAPEVWLRHQSQPKLLIKELRAREARTGMSARLRVLEGSFGVA